MILWTIFSSPLLAQDLFPLQFFLYIWESRDDLFSCFSISAEFIPYVILFHIYILVKQEHILRVSVFYT